MALQFLNDGYFAGKVGIGTESPDRKLHVNSGSTNIVATFESTDATAAISLQDNSTTNDSKVQIRAIGDDFNIVAGGSQRVTVNSSGDVGIGTTSPSAKLHIKTSSTSNTNQLLLESTDAGASSGPDLALYRNSASPADGDVLGALWFYGNNSTPVQELYSGILSIANDVTDGTEDSEIRFLNMVNGTLQTPMTIDGLNVGIGVTDPSRNLQVKGTANAAIAITATTTGLAQLALGDTDDDNYAQIILDNSTNKLQIQNGGGGIVSDRGITLDSSENVGIGTDSPSRPLHVNGGALNFVAEFQSTDDKASILIQDDDTLNYIHSQDGYLSLGGQNQLSDSNLNINSSSGNVGIGTTTPNGKLTVKSSGFGTAYNDYDSIYIDNGDVTAGEDNYGNGIGFSRLGSQTYKKAAIVPVQGTSDEDNLGLAFFTSPNSGFADVVEEAMRVDYNGKVGIGTTSPGYTLEIAGPSTTSFAYQRTGVSANKWGFHSDNDATYWQNLTSGNLLFTLQNGGNVGIGTTSPDLKLDVTHATAGEYVATFQNTGANLELKLGVTSTSYLNIQGQQINNSAAFNISLQADGGNVGINTTIPTQKLHVVGNARVTGAYYDSNNSPGTANQVLISTVTGTDWVDGSGSSIIGGPYLPLSGGTMTGTNGVLMPDNFKLKFGDATTPDLEIYHDGTHSYIYDAGTGRLNVRTNHFRLVNAANSEIIIDATENGSVDLYYNNSKKLETTSTGVTVTGDIQIDSALLSNQENTDVDTGTETVANVAIATYTAAFFDFVIKKTTNVRSGTVYACHDGTNVEFTETSTQDLGDTSDVTLSVDISGGNMRLRATTTSDDWSVKSLIRAI